MSSKDQLCVLEKFVPGELPYTEGWGIDLAQEALDGSVNIAALTSFFRSMKAVFSCSIVTGPSYLAFLLLAAIPGRHATLKTLDVCSPFVRLVTTADFNSWGI